MDCEVRTPRCYKFVSTPIERFHHCCHFFCSTVFTCWGKQTVNCHAQPACLFALCEHAVPLYVSDWEHVSLHIDMSTSHFLCAAHFSLYFDRNHGDEESSNECRPCEPIIGQYVIPEITHLRAHYPPAMPCSRESPLSSSGFTCGKARQFLNRNSYHIIFRKITQCRIISNRNSGRQSVREG